MASAIGGVVSSKAWRRTGAWPSAIFGSSSHQSGGGGSSDASSTISPRLTYTCGSSSINAAKMTYLAAAYGETSPSASWRLAAKHLRITAKSGWRGEEAVASKHRFSWPKAAACGTHHWRRRGGGVKLGDIRRRFSSKIMKAKTVSHLSVAKKKMWRRKIGGAYTT